MNSLFKLLKVNFINSTGLNAFSKSESSSKTKSKLLKTSSIIIAGAIGVLLLVFMYAEAIAEMLLTMNAINVLPILAGIITTITITFMSIFKAQGILFSSKDYDLLMSFPIDSKVILASKILNMLTINLALSTLILFPTTVVYYQNAETSPMAFVYALIGIILIPLIPTIIASLCAFAISYASSKVRFTNKMSLIGMVVLMGGIFLASSKMQDIIMYFQERASTLEDMFGKMYPPAGWYGELITTGNIMALFKLVLISVVPFIIFLLVFGKSFKKINARLGESYKKANYKVTSLKSESIIKALIRKEIKRYTSCTIYIFNTALGTVLIPLAAIGSIFMIGEAEMEMINTIYGEGMLPLMLIGMFCFFMVTTCTTASSISLEGKNLWILKSLPIPVMDIFKGKMTITILTSIPSVIVASIIMKFSLQLAIMDTLWLILIPSAFAVFMAIFGLFINLNYPKFDWTQEVKVVKNSLSVLITVFGGFGVIVAGASIVAILKQANLNNNLIFAIILAIIISMILGTWKLLKTKGVEMFNRL